MGMIIQATGGPIGSQSVTPGWYHVRLDPLQPCRSADFDDLHCLWTIDEVKIRTPGGIFWVGVDATLALDGGAQGEAWEVSIFNTPPPPSKLRKFPHVTFEVHKR